MLGHLNYEGRGRVEQARFAFRDPSELRKRYVSRSSAHLAHYLSGRHIGCVECAGPMGVKPVVKSVIVPAHAASSPTVTTTTTPPPTTSSPPQ